MKVIVLYIKCNDRVGAFHDLCAMLTTIADFDIYVFLNFDLTVVLAGCF